MDGPTRRSRGFGFVYYETVSDAEAAREAMNGAQLDGNSIRVDFSVTKEPHRATPGVYIHKGRATKPGTRPGKGPPRGGDRDRRGHRPPPPTRGDHRDYRDHYKDDYYRDYSSRDYYER